MSVSSGCRILELDMANTKIKVGDKVIITVKHNSPLLPGKFKHIPKTVTFEGEVLPKADYDPHDSVRITSDDPMVDLRVIMFKNILSWNGNKFHYTSHEVLKASMPEYVIVQGSNSNSYQITISGDGTKTCTCPGFGFRGRCKHVDQYNAEHSDGSSIEN
jgi:hypothetical protein